jgi:hypothetical protein
MAMEINDIGELQTLFDKAYLIESNFELTMEWDAYINSEEDFKNLLFSLAHDSELHRKQILDLSKKIEGIHIKEKFDKKNPMFDFSQMIDEAMFVQLVKYEKLALDLYTKMHDLTNKDFIKSHWKDDNYQEYFDKFKWLIEEEKNI